MYYAKSKPIESIKEHTDKLLENLKLLKNTYGDQIVEDVNIDKTRFWKLLEIICKYHDIGKVYTPFQNMIRTDIGEQEINTEFSYENIKHEQISPVFVPVNKYELTKDEKKLVYQAIYYHHEKEGKSINSTYLKEIIENDLKPQIEEIKKEFGYEIDENLSYFYIKYVQDINRIKEGDKLYSEYCLLKGLLHRLDHSSSANIQVEDNTKENISDYTDKFMLSKNYDLNDLQKFCRENNNKNLLVIGSTGMGKTESALFWSNGYKTFFTLPIRTSINAIYERIDDTIGYKHVGLLHSTALEYLEEKNEFENQEEVYNQSKNLYEKVTTCTIDQIFPFVFKYKGYEKIYATLSYSKIIIDEIQAYSPEIVAVIIKGLEMINKLGGKFMIMTATLPRIYKEELTKLGINYEFNQFIKPIIRHKIKLENKEIIDDIDEISKKASKSKVLIIVNTVNKAIELYMKLKEKHVDNINLLHSRFIYKDRNKKEQDIKSFSNAKNKYGIWITTQIVEASLDIDFDYLYTEMSTLDSLFQRLGRCYRSRIYEKNEENIHIYIKNSSGIKSIYDEEINKKSIELLANYDNEFLEENTKIELVDKLYSEDMLSGTKFLNNFKNGMKVLNNILDYNTTKSVAQKLLRNIDNISVIPKNIYEENLELFKEYDKEKNDYKRKNNLKRKIDKLTISISSGQRYKIKDSLINNPYYQNALIVNLKYNDEVGLILEKDDEYDLDEKFL